jgi:hypothetical protein
LATFSLPAYAGHAVHDGRNGLAGTAPNGPEIHQNRLLALEHLLVERCIADFQTPNPAMILLAATCALPVYGTGLHGMRQLGKVANRALNSAKQQEGEKLGNAKAEHPYENTEMGALFEPIAN